MAGWHESTNSALVGANATGMAGGRWDAATSRNASNPNASVPLASRSRAGAVDGQGPQQHFPGEGCEEMLETAASAAAAGTGDGEPGASGCEARHRGHRPPLPPTATVTGQGMRDHYGGAQGRLIARGVKASPRAASTWEETPAGWASPRSQAGASPGGASPRSRVSSPVLRGTSPLRGFSSSMEERRQSPTTSAEEWGGAGRRGGGEAAVGGGIVSSTRAAMLTRAVYSESQYNVFINYEIG